MRKMICIILLFLLLVANVGQAQFNDSEPIFGQMLNLGHWSTDGLVFYWRGIEAGEVVDESFYRNNGTITGATWSAEGLDFDASVNQYVAWSSSNLDTISTSYTLIFWYNLDSTEAFSGFFKRADTVTSTDAQIELYIQADGDLTATHNREGDIYYFTTTSTPFAIYPSGMLALTWANQVWSAYINAIPLSFTPVGTKGDPATGDPCFMFGYEDNGCINGRIKSAAAYNRGLSASEIAELYINRDLPMQHEPIWLMYSPDVGGIVPIIQAHTRRRRAG